MQDGSFDFSADQVHAALSSFPPGSGAGPSGPKPSHLKELLNCSERPRLLDALVSLSGDIASGGFPSESMSLFTAARLIALPKKSGGLRPIAVGDTLRRLAAKCLLGVVIPSASTFLLPLQVGVQVPNAAERVARHVSLWARTRSEDEIILQVDIA